MLQAVLEYVNNWFERDIYAGAWEIADGALTANPGIAEGQYYRIVGSVFNDGLHRWPATGEQHPESLNDERFVGEVRALAVPGSVVALAGEIAQWCTDNAKALGSPYSSESFGGYSYVKADGSKSGANGGADAWKDHFRSSLNAWRKL